MLSFRKIAASSRGALIRAYFTENRPEQDKDLKKQSANGEKLAAYYTGRDSRAIWRLDMPKTVAAALGINLFQSPTDQALDRLFEGKRADNGENWSNNKRKISAYDLTFAPHKSVSLAIEFAKSNIEKAAIWHAIQQANDEAMRYVAHEIGVARRGHGGKNGVQAGEVGWVSFQHSTARPTLQAKDGKDGATYLVDIPIGGDPHAHIHNTLFNIVVTEDGHIGSLDTARLQQRVHEFGAYFQVQLAHRLRKLGISYQYDKELVAVQLNNIPQEANELFSKSAKQVERNARLTAKNQGYDWEKLPLKGRLKYMRLSALNNRQKKDAGDNHTLWYEQAETIGWNHETVMTDTYGFPWNDIERTEQAYRFATEQLAKDFVNEAVLDYDKLRLYATRGLILTGLGEDENTSKEVDKIVEEIERRGLQIKEKQVKLIIGMSNGRKSITHSQQVRIEKELAYYTKQAANDKKSALSVSVLTSYIQQSNLDFNSEHGKRQKAAIYALGTGGNLTLLTGVAGSGKTTLLKPLVAAWKQDKSFSNQGREVIGVATAWRQADALQDAGIQKYYAMTGLIHAFEQGKLIASQNTVLIIDEISQVSAKHLLYLLRLQQKTGMSIKMMGDREQTQSIEAGDVIEIMQRVLPKEQSLELLNSVRQKKVRDQKIASLFRGKKPTKAELKVFMQRDNLKLSKGKGFTRLGMDQEKKLLAAYHQAEVKEAITMKREDGTIRLVKGDHDAVLQEIADFYIERRDRLAVKGQTITMTTLTNQDAADLSMAVRERMKIRGEISNNERQIPAIDQRGESYILPLAIGDKVRLYHRVKGITMKKKAAYAGNNGEIVEVINHDNEYLWIKNRFENIVKVKWDDLRDQKTKRIKLGFGHAMTIDASQGITSDEHINAMPRGVGTITGFSAYVAESRAKGKTWTMISDGATFEAVRQKRALGDIEPVTSEDLWNHISEAMSQKPYKQLGMDLAANALKHHEKIITRFILFGKKIEEMKASGHDYRNDILLSIEGKKLQVYIAKEKIKLNEEIQQMMRLNQKREKMAEKEVELRKAWYGMANIKQIITPESSASPSESVKLNKQLSSSPSAGV